MIPFTKPFLPKRQDFDSLVSQIWQNHWLTNQGPLVSELEERMANFLEVEHISFVSSGTMGLQLALRSLQRKGEIITTPYSYVATTSSIVWEGHRPVFADILPDKLTLDPQKVEALIGDETVAILPTHVYGNACDTKAFDEISRKYDIPVIYDAAHCFGSKHAGKSLLAYGDFAVLSTHATKLFHTANGGFVVSKSAEGKLRIDRFKNFGHHGQNNFESLGINGKNSELHAAMGLSLFPHAKELIERRHMQWNRYADALKDTSFGILQIENKAGYNGAYFPITCSDSFALSGFIESANKIEIELRRYFSPSLENLPYIDSTKMPISNDIASRTFCLPMYHDMKLEEQNRVIDFLISSDK